MRVLHTADWHVGKKLGRIDRRMEVEAVLDELVAIADDAHVDAVLVSGDLFDRAGPQLDNMSLVLQTLVRLTDGRKRRVVAIPGNHDSAGLFRVLAPLLEGFGVHLVDRCTEPGEGGVLSVPSLDGTQTLRVACVPFIHEAQVIDILEPPAEGYKSYAERIRAVTTHYADWMLEHPVGGGVDVLMGHFMVHKAIPSGSERELHIGDAYMARADAIPTTVKYAALGHIHKAQEAPGAGVPARFSGSLMQLDFGEAGQDKSVCVVDLEPGMKPASVECVPVRSGRSLLKVSDPLESLKQRVDEFGDAWLHVSVKTEGPHPGIAEEVRAFLPNALVVVADYERRAVSSEAREGRSLSEQYSDYVQEKRGVEPDAALRAAFDSLADEVGAHL